MALKKYSKAKDVQSTKWLLYFRTKTTTTTILLLEKYPKAADAPLTLYVTIYMSQISCQMQTLNGTFLDKHYIPFCLKQQTNKKYCN